MKFHIRGLLLCVLGLAVWQQASGIVLSYYRFEQDDNPDVNALSTPDFISGGPSLTAAFAGIDTTTNAPDLPGGQPNNASLDGLLPLTSPSLNATAAYNSVLSVAELTVEFFARTEESTAVMVARSTSVGADTLTSISNGFRIYDPAALQVQFWTTGAGGTVTNQINTAVGLDSNSMTDGIAEWLHVAFTYKQSTGEGLLYLNGAVIGSATATAGDSLYWGAGSPEPGLTVGWEMDGFDFSKTADDNGFMDELRFSDQALPPEELLFVPEPSSFAFLASLVVLLWTGVRRRR